MKGVKLAVFAALGVLLLVGAAWSVTRQVTFLRTAAHATGRVLDPGPGGRHASIAFQAPDGRTVQFQSQGLIGSVQKDQDVPVIFRTADPEGSAQVGWLIPLFFAPGILTIIGAGFLAGALLGRD